MPPAEWLLPFCIIHRDSSAARGRCWEASSFDGGPQPPSAEDAPTASPVAAVKAVVVADSKAPPPPAAEPGVIAAA